MIECIKYIKSLKQASSLLSLGYVYKRQVWTLNVGSSSANFCNANAILSWSALDLGSTANWITGSGTTTVSYTHLDVYKRKPFGIM